ncbi:MAG: hypothetical protein Q9220_007220 [cf. Caloplaca sp. 1 TL-2023]
MSLHSHYIRYLCGNEPSAVALARCKRWIKEELDIQAVAMQNTQLTVQAIFTHLKERQQQGDITSEEFAQWSNDVNTKHGAANIREVLRLGENLAKKLLTLEETLQEHWQHGAYDILPPQMYSTPVSIKTMQLLTAVATRTTFAAAQQQLRNIIHDRLTTSTSHTETLLPRDVKKLLESTRQMKSKSLRAKRANASKRKRSSSQQQDEDDDVETDMEQGEEPNKEHEKSTRPRLESSPFVPTPEQFRHHPRASEIPDDFSLLEPPIIFAPEDQSSPPFEPPPSRYSPPTLEDRDLSDAAAVPQVPPREDLSLSQPCFNKPESPSGLEQESLEGALNSLKPGRWVSATAIDWILAICVLDGFRTFIGFSISQPSLPPRSSRRLEPSTTILLPLFHEAHWMLGSVDTIRHAITFFDSLSDIYNIDAQEALTIFGDEITAQSSQWHFKAVHRPAQENSDDCGIFLLATALHLLAQKPLPDSPYDCLLWREILTALVSGQYNTKSMGIPDRSPSLLGDLESALSTSDNISELQNFHRNLRHGARQAQKAVEDAESAVDIVDTLLQRKHDMLQESRDTYDKYDRDAAALDQCLKQYLSMQLLRNQETADRLRREQAEVARQCAKMEHRIRQLEQNEQHLTAALAVAQAALQQRQAHRSRLADRQREMMTVLREKRDEYLGFASQLETMIGGETTP